MEQIALYKDFRLRAYQDWSGQWLAEAKRPFDANPEYIATPFPHPTPEADLDLVKQLIDGESTQGSPQTKPSNEDNSGSAMLTALRAEFRRTSSTASPGSANDSPSKKVIWLICFSHFGPSTGLETGAKFPCGPRRRGDRIAAILLRLLTAFVGTKRWV